MTDKAMKHHARRRAWCEWDDFQGTQDRALQALTDPDAPAMPPFHLLSMPGVTPAQQHLCAERWMADRLKASDTDRTLLSEEFAARDAMKARASTPHSPGQRLKLGYLSNDFQQHATALLMIEMLEAHDRANFALHAYSYGADNGHGMRQRLQTRFDHFTDISGLDDMQAARAIHADGIDILIDLKGYTAGTRTALLTYRPAPLQVSFLGYPGTLGGSFCDYLITDSFVTPAHALSDYSEALACMPHSYQPHAGPALIGPPPCRASEGLPEDGLVYCCFNQAYKFTPDVFDIRCRLLDRVPGSVLWLLDDECARGNLRLEAMQRGIAPHRLVFAPNRPQAAHLLRLQLADLVLDTLPYNAHTTASDALWAGVPVLTCAGDTFASRVAGSLLHAVGLPELVTHDLQAYADLAMQLSADPARLKALRDKLAANRPTAALFDVPRYTQDIEALFTQMWHRHLSGQPPQAIAPRVL